jgi:hypothetical protein
MNEERTGKRLQQVEHIRGHLWQMCCLFFFHIRILIIPHWYRKGGQESVIMWLMKLSSYKPGDKSWMRKGPESVYNKWNISVVICDRYFITVNPVMVATVKLSKWWLQLNQEEPLNNQIKDEVTLHFVYLTYYAKNKSCTQFILRVPRTSLYLRE